MFTLGTVLLILSATDPVRLAAPPFSIKGVDQKDADFFLDTFAQELKSADVAVTTAADIQMLLGMERQRAMLGCDEGNTSCVAELANALGVDGVVRGSVGLFDGTYVANLKVLRTGDGADLASITITAKGETLLVSELQRAARDLRLQLMARLRPTEAAAAQRSESRRVLAVVPLVVGLGGVGVGAALMGTAESKASALVRQDLVAVTVPAEDYAGAARTERLAGQVLVGVGVAALVAAAGMFVFLGPSQVQPAASISREGVTFGLVGVMP